MEDYKVDPEWSIPEESEEEYREAQRIAAEEARAQAEADWEAYLDDMANFPDEPWTPEEIEEYEAWYSEHESRKAG